MSNHTYRVTEVVGTSPDGVDQAVRNAITRASQTLRKLDWFEVTQVRGQIEDGQVAHWQVGLQARLPSGGVGLTPLGRARPSGAALALLRHAQLGRPGRPARPEHGETGPLGVVADQLVVVHQDPDLAGPREPPQDLQLGTPGGPAVAVAAHVHRSVRQTLRGQPVEGVALGSARGRPGQVDDLALLALSRTSAMPLASGGSCGAAAKRRPSPAAGAPGTAAGARCRRGCCPGRTRPPGPCCCRSPAHLERAAAESRGVGTLNTM